MSLLGKMADRIKPQNLGTVLFGNSGLVVSNDAPDIVKDAAEYGQKLYGVDRIRICDGVDDDLDWLAVKNVIQAVGSGSIYATEGEFYFGSPLDISSGWETEIYWHGAGREATKIKPTADMDSLFDATGQARGGIFDMMLDGDGTNYTMNLALLFGYMYRFSIERVFFGWSSRRGIQFYHATTGDIETVIDDCWFWGNGDEGIYNTQSHCCNSVRLINSFFYDNEEAHLGGKCVGWKILCNCFSTISATTDKHGIHLLGASDNTDISHNWFIGVDHIPVKLEPDAGIIMRSIHINDNDFRDQNTGYPLIAIDGHATSSVRNLEIKGNQAAYNINVNSFIRIGSPIDGAIITHNDSDIAGVITNWIYNNDLSHVGNNCVIKDNIGYIHRGEVRTASGELAAGNANAICFAWHNPENQDILVKKVVIEVTTAGGTPGSHLDVGIADDATGTNRGTEFFDDLDLNAAQIDDSWVAGDGGQQTKYVFCQDNASATDGWIVGQILDANAASLEGKYYIEYVGR